MIEIILISVSIVINCIILYYVTRPKIIEIYKDPVGTERRAIMTPKGTFYHETKRDPVFNDDESLFLREDDN